MKFTEGYEMNTGGNCMVYSIPIEEGGALKLIGIGDNYIVGYNAPWEQIENEFNTLWSIAVNWNDLWTVALELQKKLPVDVSEHVLRTLIRIDGYDLLKNKIKEGRTLFMHQGVAIEDPFTDETKWYNVDPLNHYGIYKIVSAIHKDYTKSERLSNLEAIGKALLDYNENGSCLITNTESDCREVAEYVRSVLDGLKCSYDWSYHDVEDFVFIEDKM